VGTPEFVLGETGTITATVRDTTSGPVSATVGASAGTATVGSASVTLRGSDAAGRSSTATCGYLVGYDFSGFSAPVEEDNVNVAKAGGTIPLKWRLSDYQGAPVTDLSAIQVAVTSTSCDPTAPEQSVTEMTAGASGLQSLGNGNYQYNWKTPKAYAGSCRKLGLDLGEGMLRGAEFRFTN
jgi:hypothetical protein